MHLNAHEETVKAKGLQKMVLSAGVESLQKSKVKLVTLVEGDQKAPFQ